MARPRKQTYPLETYLNSNKEGDISNNADTQRKPAWKPIIDGLIVTILTDEYIPPIILAEEENSQLDIVDGGSRTAAIMMFRYGNYKISSSVEDSVISYKKKNKDVNGNIVWEDATFDIKGKTYNQLPDELKKKFNGYQLETVIHENCNKNKIAIYIKRYNEHSSMNTNQKAYTYIDNFARKINKIVQEDFFLNNKSYSDNDREKGVIERIVIETVMCMNHFDNWKTQPKSCYKYLNEHATEEEFDVFADNLHRIENIVTEEIKDIFNKKDSFIFLTLFDKFVKFSEDDKNFADFLSEFKNNFRNSQRNEKGLLFDEIDSKKNENGKRGSTKDKRVITDKLELLEKLMMEYLHISKEEVEEQSVEEFVAENLDLDVVEVEDDIDFYNESLDALLEDTVKVDSKLRNQENRLSLLVMMAYSYKEDKDLDDWLAEYAKSNNTYFIDQRKNFLHMKQDFEQWQRESSEKENRKSA